MIEFLSANWLWIGVVALFVLMRRSGHGCGMHGGHNHSRQHQSNRTEHPASDERHEQSRT